MTDLRRIQVVDSHTGGEPTRIVIVEGILVFVEERIRRLLDVKIFVDTDPDIRVFRHCKPA